MGASSVLGSRHGLLGHEGATEAVLALAGATSFPMGTIMKKLLTRRMRTTLGPSSAKHVVAFPAPLWASAFPFIKQKSGKGLANLPALRNSENNPFPTPAQTCSEGKEADLVFVLLKQRHDPLPHALVPLVDELLAEVAVNLLGCHLLVRRERRVDKVGQL